MLETPPILTIQRKFARPDAKKVAKLVGALTGNIADCMGGRGALDPAIKPLADSPAGMRAVVGPAFPCQNAPSDQLGAMAALAHAEAGDVIVAATEGYTGTAVVGDLMLGMARNRGIAGLVTDGAVRDLGGIFRVGLPVFCAGVNPDSPARTGPGSAGLPVTIGDATVHPGDIVVADSDGVVIVPQALLDKVIEKLAEVRVAEAEMEAKVDDGLEIPDSWSTLFDSDQVRYID
jgi:4-hydroxy-4-methyl-2-oxoglutarate aldolase